MPISRDMQELASVADAYVTSLTDHYIRVDQRYVNAEKRSEARKGAEQAAAKELGLGPDFFAPGDVGAETLPREKHRALQEVFAILMFMQPDVAERILDAAPVLDGARDQLKSTFALTRERLVTHETEYMAAPYVERMPAEYIAATLSGMVWNADPDDGYARTAYLLPFLPVPLVEQMMAEPSASPMIEQSWDVRHIVANKFLSNPLDQIASAFRRMTPETIARLYCCIDGENTEGLKKFQNACERLSRPQQSAIIETLKPSLPVAAPPAGAAIAALMPPAAA